MKQVFRRLCALILCLAVMLPATAVFSYASTPGAVTASSVRVRTGPGTNYSAVTHNGAVIYLSAGHAVTITGEMSASDSDGYRWYPVSFNYGGASYSGFIREDLMAPSAQPVSPAVNEDFEAQLAAFPESYRPYLIALHNAHPSWNFEAMNTGFQWAYVQGKENQLGYSLIQTSVLSYRSTAEYCYDWYTDVYYPREGSSWYQAAPEVVAYYMDPRNFLNENDIFQFEKLSYIGTDQIRGGVASMLSGSFMDNAYTTDFDGKSVSYVDTFMAAGEAFNVNPIHILARCIQEVGKSGNAAGTRGNYPGFAGIYNFFNIGANTGAEDGLRYAAKTDADSFRPWNTQYKAIMGGAKFIAGSYIAVGQDTLYLQKFNVTTRNSFRHQYMSNVQAAWSEGRTTRKGYAGAGLIDSAFTFRIPVYENMPEHCYLPAAAGSPNAYLSALSVDGYAFAEEFQPWRTTYNIRLSEIVPSLTVRASCISSTAAASGNVGTVWLTAGVLNELKVVCTAAAGYTRIYTILVDVPTDGSGWNPFLNIDEEAKLVSGISPGTTRDGLMSDLNLFGKSRAQLLTPDGNETLGIVTTGQTLRYFDGESATDYTVIIYGDVFPDGALNEADLDALRDVLLEKSDPGAAVLRAADIDHDGEVDAADLLHLHKDVKGQLKISQS